MEDTVWFKCGIYLFFELDSDEIAKKKSTENIIGKCLLCPKSKQVRISGRIRVSSNFVKHVKVCIIKLLIINFHLNFLLILTQIIKTY
jgi:hypothetical protein